jgi:hypothetical protein
MHRSSYVHLAGILAVFGVGIVLFGTGMVVQSAPLLYSSGGVSALGIVLGIWLFVTQGRKQATFEAPPAPLRIYRDPSMKRNKSDTDLELMATAKNTIDDAALP